MVVTVVLHQICLHRSLVSLSKIYATRKARGQYGAQDLGSSLKQSSFLGPKYSTATI